MDFFIDRGGTFTDVISVSPTNGYQTTKLLSTDSQNYPDAPREGIRRILEIETGTKICPDKPLDTSLIRSIRMGTTVATNALLEREGEPFCLVTTSGFGDLWQIGNQSRPQIFEVDIKKSKPEVLYSEVVEVEERVIVFDAKFASGREVRNIEGEEDARCTKGESGERILVEKEIDLSKVRAALIKVFQKGLRSVAICLMHAAIYPSHEKQIAGLCKDIGFTQISTSHEVMQTVKIVPRGHTTMCDAYLTPHIHQYMHNFVKGFDDNLLKNVQVSFMQSDGGLTDMFKFSGHRAILSGPAGGVVGVAHLAYVAPMEFKNQNPDKQYREIKPVIGFDMGGTSTDVCRFSGVFEHVFENITAGVTIQAPQLDISTVAAGGGSKLNFSNNMLLVGPESVGAEPGPVCYRKTQYSGVSSIKGELSVTDANLLLGRLIPSVFPAIFGKNKNEPLDIQATQKAFNEMFHQVSETNIKSVEDLALGFLEVANEAMCRPIRGLTQMKGFNTRDHALVSFGGAGGQHACAIASKLGIDTVIIHRFSGVLSAVGIGLANKVIEKQSPTNFTFYRASDNSVVSKEKVKTAFEQLEANLSVNGKRVFRFLNMRYEGTDCSLMISLENGIANYSIVQKFEENHKREFGFLLPTRDIVVDDIRIRCEEVSSRKMHSKSSVFLISPSLVYVEPIMETSVYFFNCWHRNVKVYHLQHMISKFTHANDRFKAEGPIILVNDTSTIVVEPNWMAEVTIDGDVLLIKTVEPSASHTEQEIEVDPIELSLYCHRFMGIAEQMGKTLRRTSVSVNIKERLDFSCALFSADGDLVANAPHIPVHLGAMQEAVRAQVRFWDSQYSGSPEVANILEKLKLDYSFEEGINEGDVFMSNHPQLGGGSHLPDITVITPIFYNQQVVFWVASRGHHADVGGIAPGSMPPNSKFLSEEGVAILTFKLVEQGVFQESKVRDLLLTPPDPKKPNSYGTRIIEDNISDLKAQVAANQCGIKLIDELITQETFTKVSAYMKYIMDASDMAISTMLKKVCSLNNRTVFTSQEFMDDGTVIKVRITINPETGQAKFDFTGTGPQVWGNTNAPPAVTHSAVIYCLRCMLSLNPDVGGFVDIPLNQGCLGSVEIVIPEGSILSPSSTAAVVGGNVLTSQRLVDVIFLAFESVAASQGCTNNLTFGDDTFGYYETIAGGAGAGNGFEGESGIHTHMTNTRITDPEILERRYPVILRRFGVRSLSGGIGNYNGGDGVVREIEFRRPLNLSVLSERRNMQFKPYGLKGGRSGSNGKNLMFNSRTSKWQNIGGKAVVPVQQKDRIRILTPGGGGFGKHRASSRL